jgi:hypothetical protein
LTASGVLGQSSGEIPEIRGAGDHEPVLPREPPTGARPELSIEWILSKRLEIAVTIFGD